MTLTKTQRELLKTMAFREAPPGGPCWVVATARGRYALWVFTMMGKYGYLKDISGSTLRKLHTAGLIEYGEDVKMPDWHRPRSPQEATEGSTATLTDAGRAALDGAQ